MNLTWNVNLSNSEKSAKQLNENIQTLTRTGDNTDKDNSELKPTIVFKNGHIEELKFS